MAKAIYDDLMSSVTYRGKTFRVGDDVKICRDTSEWYAEERFKGGTVKIEEIDDTDGSLLILCQDHDTWYVSLESLFEYSEEDEPQQTQPERKPWDMPELKPWMRVVNPLGTYLIAEVDGVLTGLRVGGCENIEYLKESADEIYGAPLLCGGTIARYQVLDTKHKGELLWSRTEAYKQRQSYGAKEARRQEIQAEIDKLKVELEAIF